MTRYKRKPPSEFQLKIMEILLWVQFLVVLAWIGTFVWGFGRLSA